jgi:hypothetical protein
LQVQAEEDFGQYLKTAHQQTKAEETQAVEVQEAVAQEEEAQVEVEALLQERSSHK